MGLFIIGGDGFIPIGIGSYSGIHRGQIEPGSRGGAGKMIALVPAGGLGGAGNKARATQGVHPARRMRSPQAATRRSMLRTMSR